MANSFPRLLFSKCDRQMCAVVRGRAEGLVDQLQPVLRVEACPGAISIAGASRVSRSSLDGGSVLKEQTWVQSISHVCLLLFAAAGCGGWGEDPIGPAAACDSSMFLVVTAPIKASTRVISFVYVS